MFTFFIWCQKDLQLQLRSYCVKHWTVIFYFIQALSKSTGTSRVRVILPLQPVSLMEVKLRMPEERVPVLRSVWAEYMPFLHQQKHNTAVKNTLYLLTLSHKRTLNFKLSWTNHGKHSKAAHFPYEDRWSHQSCLRNCELTSARSNAEKNWGEKHPKTTTRHGFPVYKVAARVARRNNFEASGLAGWQR